MKKLLSILALLSLLAGTVIALTDVPGIGAWPSGKKVLREWEAALEVHYDGMNGSAGTFTRTIFIAPEACTITAISFVPSVAIDDEAGQLWTVELDNVTDTADMNSTDYVTTSDPAAGAKTSLLADQNLTLDSGDVVVTTWTETGTADPLDVAGLLFVVEYD